MERIARILFVLLGIVLNGWTICKDARNMHYNESLILGSADEHDHSSIVVNSTHLELCLNNGSDGKDCVATPFDRFYAMQTLQYIEFLLYWSLTFGALTFSCLFLCKSSRDADATQGQSHGVSRRADFVGRHPFLVFLPRCISRFSLMMFLPFLQPALTWKAFRRGDFHVLAGFIAKSLAITRERDSSTLHMDRLSCKAFAVASIFIMLLMAASFQSLLIKLTKIYFAAVTSWNYWTWLGLLEVLGFVNQIMGLFDTNLVELNRIFLMKCAGTQGLWFRT